MCDESGILKWGMKIDYGVWTLKNREVSEELTPAGNKCKTR